MVKRQREKQYESAREHRANSQLRSLHPDGSGGGGDAVRKLPFHCCALSLLPFSTPVCTDNGIVYEKAAIEAFIQHHKMDPVTGKPMTGEDLWTLHMTRDEEGRWSCPIMTKPFADHTKIVAIRQTPGNQANVYSWEAYHELNVKAKNWEDLISGRKFQKSDVMLLNSDEPDFIKLRDINTFYHIRNQRELEQIKVTSGSRNSIKHSVTSARILEKFHQQQSTGKRTTVGESQRAEGQRLKIFSDDVTGVKFTSGKGSGSFTSTAMPVMQDNDAREATQEEVLQALFQVLRRQKKKGYVTLRTNFGDLLLEIHCDIVPRTATNFMKLCEAKKYAKSSFHRLIKGFMIQGGSPADSSEQDGDDDSIWGGEFKDEFDDRLKHNGPGILSMANAGPHTNRRQFFITFNNCEYLNRKHSVFGAVVQGLDLLMDLEKIPTDEKDRPLQSITIEDTIIVEDPVKMAEDMEMKRIQSRAEARQKPVGSEKKSAPKQSAPLAPTVISQIGRYLPKAAATPAGSSAKGEDLTTTKPSTIPAPKKPKTKFGNFGSW